MSPAERADVIVDFTDVPAGTGDHYPEPRPGRAVQRRRAGRGLRRGEPGHDRPGDEVPGRPEPRPRHQHPAEQLTLPKLTPLGAASNTRKVSLNEVDSEVLDDVGPRAALLGTMNGTPNALEWKDAITENPAVGATEVWEMHNFTADAHPIHVHEVQFQVVNRQPFEGAARPPESWETGFKDTVIAYPGEITRIKARFGVGGRFVWHCHIVEHEDNEMMRPYFIGPMP